MNKGRSVLSVRAFVEAASYAEAILIWSRLESFSQKYGATQLRQLRPYWKINGQFEVFYEIVPMVSVGESFSAFAAGIGLAGTNISDQEAIWVRSDAGSIVEPSVSWMSLEVVS